MFSAFQRYCVIAGLAASALLVSANASAIAVSCGISNASSYVEGASACQKSTSATQDFLGTPLTVNTEKFFGITDWLFAGKTGDSSGGVDIGFDADGINKTSGDWEIDPTAWSGWDNIMLVFKSGSGTTLTGFLLNGTATNGDWYSPFRRALFDDLRRNQVKDVSHISAYVSGPRFSVPEPGTVALMGAGIVLLGWRLRRVKQ